MRLGLRGGVLLASLLLLAPATAMAGDGAETQATKKAERAARKAAKRAAREAEREARKKQRAPLKQAKAYRKLELKDGLEERVKKLTTELTWHDSLEAAQAEAKAQNKPILWVQALGDLRGVL